MGIMDKMGFIGDPKKWSGRTIERAELVPMQFGSTSSSCVLLKFSDGSRGWCLGRNSDGLMTGPDIDKLADSQIVTADEYGVLIADRKREQDRRREDELRRKRQDLERLRRELGE